MKHLKLSSMLILIPLALLLSAASAESQSQPNQGSQTQGSAQSHNSIASASITSPIKPSAEPTPNGGTTNIYNEYKQSSPCGNLPAWLEAISTIGLVAFAWWQMDFVRRSTTATENAAKAASDAVTATQQMTAATEQSVKIATIALKGSRPYLLVERPAVFRGAGAPSHLRLLLRNYGEGPAVVLSVVGRLIISSDLPPKGDFTDCRRLQPSVEIVAKDRLLVIDTHPIDALATNLTYAAHPDGVRDVMAYGRITYSDPFGDKYETAFLYQYRVRRDSDSALSQGMSGYWSRGPNTQNYHT